MTFSSTGSYNPDSRLVRHRWEFGDAAVAAQPQTSHTYRIPGTYIARLTVTDPRGASGSAEVMITVTAAQPMKASMPTMSPPGGSFDGPVSVTLATATAGATIRYTLDGTAPTAAALRYTSSFTLTASATVKAHASRDGFLDSDTAQALFMLAASNQPPVARISAVPRSGLAPLSVRFSSEGSRDPDGALASSAWSFGDGGETVMPHPEHVYRDAGVYTARLIVTDDRGATGEATMSITVEQASGDAQVVFELGSVAGAPGATVSVPVHLAYAGTAQASAFNCDIRYDAERLEPPSVQLGASLSHAGKQLASRRLDARTIRLLAFGLNQTAIAPGTVAVLQWRIRPGASAGTGTVTLHHTVVSAPQAQPLTAEGRPGSVTAQRANATATESWSRRRFRR